MLDEFVKHAELEEFALKEQIDARDIEPQVSMIMQFRPSRQLLELRAVEAALAKQRRYEQAARTRDEAHRLEDQEKAAHARDIELRIITVKEELAEKDKMMTAELQMRLCEELWEKVYRGQFPMPPPGAASQVRRMVSVP